MWSTRLGEHIVIHSAAAPLQPGQQARARIAHQFELHRFAHLALNDDRPVPDLTADYQVADLYRDDVAATQFAVDRQIKQGAIAHTAVLIEKKADGPHLSRL